MHTIWENFHGQKCVDSPETEFSNGGETWGILIRWSRMLSERVKLSAATGIKKISKAEKNSMTGFFYPEVE